MGRVRPACPLQQACASSFTAAAWPPWPPTASTTPPNIDVLEPDHPERRFVTALCLYSHAVDTGRAARPYNQAEAEAFARALLMPREAFGAVIGWSDLELAELFTVPLDQVWRRRRDYVAAPLRGRERRRHALTGQAPHV